MDFEKAVKEAPEFRTVEEEFIEFVSPEEIKKPVKTTPGKISKVIKLTSGYIALSKSKYGFASDNILTTASLFK